MKRMMFRRFEPIREVVTWVLVVAFCVAQLRFTQTAEASSPGTSTVSAGMAPPPAATTVESFQPDLFTGRATTSIPIAVPPGRKALQPALALTYSSSARNGWLGVGWGMDFGYIERSTRDGVPTYGSSDVFTFLLHGVNSELIQVYDGTYRAKDEGLFLRFENLGASGWRVTDKTGTKYLFGRASASRIENGANVFRWCLDKVIDPNGNTLEVTYAKYDGQTYLSQIDYTGHEPSGLAPANRVTFTLEDRPDIETGYRAGFALRMSKRLARVDTYATVGGSLSLARRYHFGYQVSSRTSRSLLSQITEVGSDGTTSLPPKTFIYQSSDEPAYTLTSNSGSAGQVAWNVRAAGADMGHDNFGCVSPSFGVPWSSPVVVNGGGSYNFGGIRVSVGTDGSISINGDKDNFVHAWTAVYVGTARTVNFTKAGGWDVACMWIQDSSYPVQVGVGSITLKAGWSIIHIVGYHQHDGFSCGFSNPLASQVDVMSPSVVVKPQLAGDVDGNGVSDLINFEPGTGKWTVSSAQSGTLTPQQTWLTGFGNAGYGPLLGDWNADGRTDIGIYSNGNWRFALSTGSNFTADAIAPFSFGQGQAISGDFNGDGINDLGTFKDGTWSVALGNGSGFTAAGSFNLNIPEAAPVLAPDDVRWVARIASYDCGHENYGCIAPYAGGPCGVPGYSIGTVAGSMSVGGITVTVGSNGSIWIPAGQDRHTWASVAVYLKTAKTLSLPSSGGWDVACMHIEPKGGSLQYVSPGSVSFPAGWTKIHITGYNQNQGISYGLGADLVSQTDIVSPDFTNEYASAPAPITGDFNGDGLTDVAVVKDRQVYVALSDGTQFQRQATGSVGFGDTGYTTADYNGDGLSDLSWYDKPNGVVRVACSTGSGFGATRTLPITFTLRADADQIQVSELNGDGLPDLGVFSSTSGGAEMALSTGSSADLLKEMANGVGAVTKVTYQPSTRLNNDYLPLVLPVVTETRTTDGVGSTNAMTYVYSKGLYDPATKELRGFGRVEARDAVSVSAITEFHQDLYRKGRAFRTEVRDAEGNPWSKVERTWSASTPYPGLDCYFTHLDQTDTVDYDGDATYRQSRTRQTYDAYGNVSAAYSDGEVSVAGDERAVTTTYTGNTTNWIVGTPSIVRTYDASGVVVAQTRLYYDGAGDLAAAPLKGNLTTTESWLDRDASGTVNRWIASRAAFDTYGNVVSATDPLNHSVSNTYDTATRTFVTKVENPLGHTRTMAYDARYNAVIAATDAAGVSTTNEYDSLGRLSRVIGPNDTRDLPTTRFEYDVSTVPTRATQYVRLQHGGASELVTHTFFDGLNRPIQVRSPAENAAQQIVTAVKEFDARGFVARQWAPYLDAASSVYRPWTMVGGVASPAVYDYDALGRLVSTTQPNGSQDTTAFSDWAVTSVDANGHQVRRVRDAHGQLVTVEEYEGLAPGATLYATTTYAYDARGNMVRLTDAKGNVTTTVYDSLGRKISMTDPDMGTSTYVYDDAGRLTSVTDARGVRTRLTFDAMGRTTRKDFDIPAGIGVPTNQAAVVYAYDNAAKAYSKGRLTEISDGSGASGFEYDKIGRVLSETLTMDGATYTNRTTYDALGRIATLTYPNRDTVGYTYNLQSGIETITLTPAGQAAQTIISNINYNAAGQLTKIAYGNGVTSDYTFNPLTWRLDRLVSTGPGGTPVQDFTYQFDPVGNVLGITDAVNSGTQTFTYDALNRLVTATGARYGSLAYAYDQIGNMTSKEGVTMTYGAVNSKPHAVMSTSSGLTLGYDASGNLSTKSGSGLGTQNLTYDAESRLVQVQVPATAPDSMRLESGWNLVGLPKLGASTSVTNAFKQFGSAYEQVSRMNGATKKFESCVGVSTVNQFSALSPGDGYWVYCGVSTGATMSLPSVAGTPAARALTNGWHVLSGPGRAMSVAEWLTPLVSGTDYGIVKTYDPLTKTMSEVTQIQPGRAYYVQMLRTASWTPSMVGGQAETVQYAYNGDGGRVKKTTAAGTTRFLGRGYEVAPDSKSTTYVFAGGQRIAARDSTGSLRYYHGDHLGSANVLTDQTGARVGLHENTPYGSVSRQEGVDVAHKFTGQRLDAETGLYFFNARYYDASIGRFIQPDSVVQWPGNPQTLNRYSYALNNPVRFNDPSGHFIQFLLAIAWVAFQGAIGGAIFGGLMAAITGGDVLQGMLSGAITGAFTAVGGFLGAMAAGALNAHIQGTDPLRGAIAGGFNFLAGAAFHAAGYITMDKANLGTYVRYVTESTVFGFGTGFVDALIYGASVEDALDCGLRGAAIGAGMGVMNVAATAMQKQVRDSSNFRENGSKIDTSEFSNGFRGSNDKAAGARWEVDRATGKVSKYDPGSLFGGTQDKVGKMFGVSYSKGSWPDMIQEIYSGPHDWLNGIFCGGYTDKGYWMTPSNPIEAAFHFMMNVTDLFIATPFAAAETYFDQVPALIHEVNQ